MGIQERKKIEPKKPSVQGWVTGDKGCKPILKRCVLMSPLLLDQNTNHQTVCVIQWSTEIFTTTTVSLINALKVEGGKGDHIKCWIPVYNGDNLDLKFIAGGKIITSKFYVLQKKKILQKNILLVSSQLGFKIH